MKIIRYINSKIFILITYKELNFLKYKEYCLLSPWRLSCNSFLTGFSLKFGCCCEWTRSNASSRFKDFWIWLSCCCWRWYDSCNCTILFCWRTARGWLWAGWIIRRFGLIAVFEVLVHFDVHYHFRVLLESRHWLVFLFLEPKFLPPLLHFLKNIYEVFYLLYQNKFVKSIFI